MGSYDGGCWIGAEAKDGLGWVSCHLYGGNECRVIPSRKANTLSNKIRGPARYRDLITYLKHETALMCYRGVHHVCEVYTLGSPLRRGGSIHRTYGIEGNRVQSRNG